MTPGEPQGEPRSEGDPAGPASIARVDQQRPREMGRLAECAAAALLLAPSVLFMACLSLACLTNLHVELKDMPRWEQELFWYEPVLFMASLLAPVLARLLRMRRVSHVCVILAISAVVLSLIAFLGGSRP